MGTIIKFLFCVYLFSLISCVPFAIIRFFIDVGKWHDKEEKVYITPSQFEADLVDTDPVSAPESELETEEEGDEYVRDDRKCNSRAFLFFRRRS